MGYVPHTEADRQRMLEAIGVDSIDRLFEVVPQESRYPSLDLPPGLSEMEVVRLFQGLAEENADLDHHPCFLGAGAYRHFIPAVVDHVLRRGSSTPPIPPINRRPAKGP